MISFQRNYDVIVAGGGAAGVAAALETARAGLRTALLEKTIQPGGLATSGLVNIYLPLCDGQGRQVTFGIAEELLLLSLKYGPGDAPAAWADAARQLSPEQEELPPSAGRYSAVFSSAAFVLALDLALQEAGVDVWLDTLVCAPIMEGARLTGVEVENKSGRGALTAERLIDATGDADIAMRAGAPCLEADNWITLWAHEASLDAARVAAKQNSGGPMLRQLRLGADSEGQRPPEGYPVLRGIDGKTVTQFALESRRLLREHYKTVHATESRHDVFPLALPSMAQFRTTRCIEGRTTLKFGDYTQTFEDSIGLASDWRKAGYVWEIPYGALLPRGVEGLLVAGRCIASTGDAWEVTRSIPAAALTGQAAGLGAALSIRREVPPSQLNPAVIQAVMKDKGLPFRRYE